MKVAILGRPSMTMGGGELVTLTLARELTDRGHDVTLFVPPFGIPGDPDNDGPEELSQAREREEFRIETTSALTYQIPGIPLLWKKMVLHPWLAFKRNRNRHFDHWFVTYGLYPVTEYWTRRGLPATHYFHGPIIADKCGPLQKYTIYPPLRGMYEALEFVGGTHFPAASNSKLTRRRIQKEHNVESEVIYPPVEVKEFAEPVSASKVPDVKYALLSGRIVPFKKFERGLENLASIVEEGVLDTVIVAGRLDNREYYDKLRERYPFVEFRTDVPGEEWIALHQQATVYVFSNHEEDFGLTGAEAAAAGTPVVTPRGPGIAEIIADWEHGYIVDKDMTGTGEAIQEIANTGMETNVPPCPQINEKCSTDKFVDLMLALAESAPTERFGQFNV